ncbi:hypothetical protein [Pseudophaeobacter sp.]|uniref:hypothetical protein n=1 Tax=Pseudophaeobacter sp. TaxID=1971739 RepID=UPI002623F754|nr:hypothetical protein [Pseudophaeobacter sp.]
MSVISGLLNQWAMRHATYVSEKYAHRKLRFLDFYKGATLQSQSFDPDRFVFNQAFYDDIRDQMNSANSAARSSFGYYVLITTAILSITLGADVTLIHSALRLGDIGVLLDFVVILAAYSIFSFIANACKEHSFRSLIQAFVQNTKIGPKSIKFRPEVEALWMAKYGTSFLDYSQNKIVVKGKYIIAPYKVRKVVSGIVGVAADIAAFGSLLFYSYVSLSLLTQPPIHLAVSIISVFLFWTIVAIGTLEFLALFFLETGILAKGRREEEADGTERDDKDALIEL